MATPEHILRCGRVPLHVGTDLTSTPPAEAARLLGGALDRWAAQHRATSEVAPV